MKGLGAVLVVLSASFFGCGSQPPTAADASSQQDVSSPVATAKGTAQTSSTAKACTAITLAADLAADLQSLEREGGLEALQAKAKACPGVGKVTLIEGKWPALAIELVDAVDVGDVAQAWSINRPFLISTTVHQSYFSLVGTEDRPAGEQRRFDKTDLQIGQWEVHVTVKRPEGPLPAEHFGPAPAYDLRAYRSVATHLTIRPRG